MANFVEKENIFLRILKYLIPWKGDKPAEVLRKIVFLVSAVVLAVSLFFLLSDANEMAEDNRNNDIISDLYHNGTTDKNPVLSGNTTLDIDITPEQQEQLKEQNPEVLEEFLPLLEINEDIVGWISMGDEEDPFIDYVVVQGDDNDFYLDHNYMKESNLGGAIFADYREPLTADSEPANLILYGHNMASDEYFGKVDRYFNYKPGSPYGISYIQKYPTFTFSSLYEKHTYKIFAGMLVNTQKSEGDVFYYLRGRNFANEENFNEYVANILDRSSFYTDVDVQYGDKLITLSTCILDYQGWDLRFVLFGRRVREGEDPTVDASKAYENPDPLYFDSYYYYYGGSWGGRKWDEELLYGHTHDHTYENKLYSAAATEE